MKREELDFLEKEQVDKVMALYGKSISKKDEEITNLNKEKEELNNKLTTYETKIKEFDENSKDNADWKIKYEELQTSIKEQEAKIKAEEQEKILDNNILEIFGDKKFTSSYAKNGLMNDIKLELGKEENKGKGIKDIFDILTKDKTDIFVNPNQVKDMAGMGDSEQNNNTKEMPTIW